MKKVEGIIPSWGAGATPRNRWTQGSNRMVAQIRLGVYPKGHNRFNLLG